MRIDWQKLPYATDALAPHISRAALSVHHAHHYRAVVNETNALLSGTPLADLPLKDIVRKTAGREEHKRLFHAAAEAWNHQFYFASMHPSGGGAPAGRLGALVTTQYGGFDGLADAFLDATLALTGNGWLWLTFERGKLDVEATANADTPIARGRTPLLAIDLWEHAYHLDHQSRRGEYVTRVLASLADWDFANANLERALAARCAAAQ